MPETPVLLPASTPAPPEGFSWRTVHGVAVLLVLGIFFYTLREILNPFLVLVLFLFLVSPQSGSRHHLLLVVATTLLTLLWLLETTGFLLAPFFLALVLAYIQHPLVSWMERKGISRNWGTTLLALPGIIGIVLIAAVGIPALGSQIAEFIQNLPSVIRSLTGWAERMQGELLRRDIPYVDEQALIGRLRSIQPNEVVAYLQERQAVLAQRAWQGVLGLGRGVGSVMSILGYVFLTPLLTFYLLRDWTRIESGLSELIPTGQRTRVLEFFREYDRLLAGYLRGNFLESAIVGALTTIALWIVGIPYAFLLGVIAGVFNLIPYIGLIISVVPAVIVALFTGNILVSLGKVAVVYAVVQALDGSFIGPKVVGDAVGLHPVWVILALSIAGAFFGFVGFLIAVPLAVLVKLLLALALARYRGSRLFQGGEVHLATGEPLQPGTAALEG